MMNIIYYFNGRYQETSILYIWAIGADLTWYVQEAGLAFGAPQTGSMR